MLNKSELQSYLDVHNLFFQEQFSKMYFKEKNKINEIYYIFNIKEIFIVMILI